MKINKYNINKNVEKVKDYLKGLRFRKTKYGLYIYGKYTTYFLNDVDLAEYSKDSLMYIQQTIDIIYQTEFCR